MGLKDMKVLSRTCHCKNNILILLSRYRRQFIFNCFFKLKLTLDLLGKKKRYLFYWTNYEFINSLVDTKYIQKILWSKETLWVRIIHGCTQIHKIST